MTFDLYDHANGKLPQYLKTVEAETAYDALAKDWYLPDGMGLIYETATLEWVGVGFCREKRRWISAERRI